MPPLNTSALDKRATARTRWRSLAELADAPEYREFLESEFPAAEDPEGVNRRRWLQVMGASLSLAAVGGGCRWEKTELLPLARRPDNRVPGEPQYFATAMELDGAAVGLLVQSVDGRPIKIEGNPQHPQSLGSTTAWHQASLLHLYDPDRSSFPVERAGPRSEKRSWEQADRALRERLAEMPGGAGLRILSEASSSPTIAAMRTRLEARLPQARWHEYEPFSRDNEREGTRLAFGKPYRVHYRLDRARRIVCFDADLLAVHPAAIEYQRFYADGREVVDGEMNRLYAVESRFTVTGAAADHRLPVRSSQIGTVVATLERAIADPSATEDAGDAVARFVHALAQDLAQHRGASVVAAGPGQPPEVHAAVQRINAALGNAGQTVLYYPEPERPSHVEDLRALVEAMKAGEVKTLVILGGNPVLDAPADLGFAEALGQVPTSIHLSLYLDETSERATWHLPQAHYLESWGDARGFDGTYTLLQPLIDPLLGGRSAIEVLAQILDEGPTSGYELVQQQFRAEFGEDGFDSRWQTAVHQGLVADSAWQPETPELQAVESDGTAAAKAGGAQGLEIVFYPDNSVFDGRFANNGWLQEMPDPLTKLTWDNAALIAPATAESLGVEHGKIARLSYAGREMEIPVCVLPGQAEGSVAVAVGYGRTAAGYVGGSETEGIAPVGVDVYRLRQSGAMYFDGGLTVTPTGRPHRLACTQDHHAIDKVGLEERGHRVGELARSATLAQYKEHPDFAHEAGHTPQVSLWKEHEFPGEHHWGMSIDLSKCIGCNACVVACQAENNVPVVGKQRVLEYREMHWLRIDRYFEGGLENPIAHHQPIPCMHCENAPCEAVCPVAATVHSREGLNEMVYNRCVGTRYCSNNCPYKVRRFNFFNFAKQFDNPRSDLTKMILNPEVTVRSRGVMEKCTYCVQRIQAARTTSVREGRLIADGEIQTACQQACPSRAIVFGDIADPSSRVAQLMAADRSYGMLEELNTQPRTRYLARIRNPNPRLEDVAHGHDHRTG